ncbi:MAG: hypothetical protein IIW52_07975 [Alistipes sp.]|nr:hypothetical protein [Alistipes sp.]
MRIDRPFFMPLAITVVSAILAAILLVSALVAWLAELLGSLKIPCLLVGSFLALMAFIVYNVSLKSYFRQISEELRVIYSVSRVIRGWLDWAATILGGKTTEEGD